MNREEFQKFVSDTYAAFPGLRQWVTEHSPDPAKTVATWFKTLANVTSAEATGVLDGWISGTIAEPPVGYRREMFALDVRAIVQRQRDELLRERVREELFRKTHVGKYQRPKALVRLSPYIDRIKEVSEKMRDGSLPQDEGNAQIDQIVSEGMHAIETKERERVSA